MSRHLTIVLCSFVLAAGCSPAPERTAASPTSPSTAAAPPESLVGPTSVAPGGINGKFDVSFPPRNDSFDFRNQLETKYQTGLGRAAAATFVDREGEVVWTQEYMRYRANGCDHATAVQRVLTQVGGGSAGSVCGTASDGAVTFPPRTDSFDFRRQLESRYQQFGRGASSSAVDAEGGVIWTQEYLRYRVNACDHATAVSKVFSQIDGGGVAATCYVPPCVFTVSPTSQSATANGGTFTATVTRTSGTDCSYVAESLDSWITITGGQTGNREANTLTYTVGRNFVGAKTGNIRIRWTGRSVLLPINQEMGTTAGFTLTDPNNSSSTTTTCLIRTRTTPCRLDVTGNFPSTATYTWAINYQYGGTISHDLTTTGTSFTFTQTCGGPGATTAGNEVPLNVTLVVTDGNSSTTVQSGQGSQPNLSIKFFGC